jgi:uncharacterized protein YndB with AHSA1/START domain
MIEHETVAPVRKTITVKTSLEHAFHVFTAGFDSWWPKSHHIGPSPMTKGILEGRAGGRCYSEQQDGTEWDWGSVLAWEPPHRLVIAWQIAPIWKYEPSLAKSSEVEIRFTPLAGGETRVDLEHRHLERHGAGAAEMRKSIDGEGGWGALLDFFAKEATRD